MTPKTIRIVKEARILFWPWLAVLFAAASPLIEHQHVTPLGGVMQDVIQNLVDPINFLGIFIGLPLLATLSLGSEFQLRTLSLVLSQPISRTEIWTEKMAVTMVAVLSAAPVFCLSRRSTFHEDLQFWVGAGALLLVMTASANFWTLIARSTMGGLALNSVNSLILIVFSVRPDWIPVSTIARSFAVFALLAYSGAMLWLGRRTLARFEVTGGLAGDDLLTSGPDFMPSALAEWFRSRPTGAVLNLIRKEFRLLRPIWLISLLAIPLWICLPLFWHTTSESIPAFILVAAYIPLVSVLAGTLPLGEERTSGTHSWHLTLPVSAGLQWLIKLALAMFTSLVCAALLPILALILSKSFFSVALLPVDSGHWASWLLPVSLLTFASFWCACTVNGTVRAALTVFPALIALGLAGRFGDWAATGLFQTGQLQFVFSKLGLYANFRFTNAASNLDLSRASDEPYWFLALLVAPALFFAIIQSFRLFRKQLQESKLFLLRRLLPLAIIAFLCAFLPVAFYAFVYDAKRSMWSMFKETHDAIEKSQPGLADRDADHPLQLTPEDLAKVSPLSERTQRWLRNSQITVTPVEPHFDRRDWRGRNADLFDITPGKPHPWYLATIHLPSGSNCTLSFRATPKFGILGGVCK